MQKSIISEGKTTNEAIEKGLKELKVSKSMVDIKVLETEGKRSFFDILAPRVVKVELTLKENIENEKTNTTTPKTEKKEERKIDEKDLETAKNNVQEFMNNFLKTVSDKPFNCEIDIVDQNIEEKY